MPNLYAFFSHMPPLNEIEEIVLARTVENGILANRELKNGNVDPKRIHLLTSEIEKAYIYFDLNTSIEAVELLTPEIRVFCTIFSFELPDELIFMLDRSASYVYLSDYKECSNITIGMLYRATKECKIAVSFS